MDHQPLASRGRKALLLAAVALLVIPAQGCQWKTLASGTGSKLTEFRRGREQMGTQVWVTVFARSPAEADRLAAVAFERIEAIESLMSSRRPESDVSRLNLEAQGKAMAVAPDTLSVLQRSIEVSRLSGGAFDVTMRPLGLLWRDGAKSGRLPSKTMIEAAKALVGYERIQLDAAKRTVQLDPGMALELGGIAKGCAVDAAIDALRRRGVTSALVDAGGDLFALGERLDGQPWRIGVQDPTYPDRQDRFLTILAVRNCAVTTSGNYQRFVEVEGRRYSTIINPKTGWPVDHVPSATVIAADCTTADALSTAFSVLSVEESMSLVGALPGVEALLISREGDKIRLTRSAGFPKFEVAR